jgi:hypothetical protein
VGNGDVELHPGTYTVHQGVAVYRAIAGVHINFNVNFNSVVGGVTYNLDGMIEQLQ